MKGRNRMKVLEDRVLRERFRVKRGNVHMYTRVNKNPSA